MKVEHTLQHLAFLLLQINNFFFSDYKTHLYTSEKQAQILCLVHFFPGVKKEVSFNLAA